MEVAPDILQASITASTTTKKYTDKWAFKLLMNSASKADQPFPTETHFQRIRDEKSEEIRLQEPRRRRVCLRDWLIFNKLFFGCRL